MDSLDVFQGTYNEKLIKKAQEKRIPISGTFELLPACNMKCKMCYIQQEPYEVKAGGGLQPVDFWVDVFQQSVEQGLLFPLLTGGEPFLYPDFFELYERIIRMGVHICINTNATLLNRERVSQLAKNPPRRLNISLYGASNETYKTLCGNPNGFRQVTEAFELLREYNIPFRVHSVLVPDNIADYDEIVNVCNAYKAPLAMAYYMFPAYRKGHNEISTEGRFLPDEMAQVALRYRRDRSGGDTQEYRQYVYTVCEAMKRPEIYSLYDHNEVACKGGKCTFWIDWKGNISGCGIHNQLSLDLHEVSFEQAWQRIVEDTDQIRISEKCKTCKYRCICQVCPAAGFCETGELSGVPQYLCEFCQEYAALLFDERKRLFTDAGDNLL